MVNGFSQYLNRAFKISEELSEAEVKPVSRSHSILGFPAERSERAIWASVKSGAASVTAGLLNKHTQLRGRLIQLLYELGQVEPPLFPRTRRGGKRTAEAGSVRAQMLFINRTVESSALWIGAHYRWRTEELENETGRRRRRRRRAVSQC